MDRNAKFANATNRVKNLRSTPSDRYLLQLYGLYKQATIGDNNSVRPMFWDVKGQAKWDAWNAYRGTSKEQAMDYYVQLVNYLEYENK
jgi:diazepam-binding inhibitor (GABA receptor modulating acyl-CoA-binding protein)